MYSVYTSYLKSLTEADTVATSDFKSSPSYTYVLEHVNVEQGRAYLKAIETEFSGVVASEDIKTYVKLNDKYGGPVRSLFTTADMTLLYCSPSALRYFYHALLVLKHYKSSGSSSIVEVGCGYGGLMTAIGHLADKMGCVIQNYHLVDLPEVCGLLRKYIPLAAPVFPYEIHESTAYGEAITGAGLFLVSNYGLSAFENAIQKSYKPLIDRTEHGFIVWQTSLGMNIRGVVGKTITSIVEERPQTGPDDGKNYFIYY